MKALEDFLLVFYQDVCVSKRLSCEKKNFYVLTLEKLVMDVCRKELERKLSLIFLDSVVRGNVCMITQNNDIRPEFRVGFTAEDLLYSFLGSYYLMSTMNSGVKLFEQWEGAVGERGVFFWDLVARGRARLV